MDAAPRGDSAEQTIGRVLRDKMTREIMPVIITVSDEWYDMKLIDT